MNSFELLDVLFFIGISQGLFLAIALQTVTNRNKSANKILSVILFIAAFMLFGRIIYFRFSNSLLRQIANTADTVILIFGPFIYSYIRRLTFNENKAFKLSIYNYIPALLIILFFGLKFSYSPKEFNFFLKSINTNIRIIYRLIELSGIISNFYYLYKSYQLIELYQKRAKDNLSFVQNIFSYANTFLIVIFLILLLWLISFINKSFGGYFSYINYNIVWVTIPILIYLIGYYSLKQPEVFRIQLKKEKKKTSKKRLEGESLSQLQEKLEFVMKEEKIYLKNDLTLKQLSEELQTTSNNLSWLLNNVYNYTFYDYINSHRINYFLNQIENGANKKHTLLALSMDSGFNSKSTFNKAFKKEMNETPTNYIKNISLN